MWSRRLFDSNNEHFHPSGDAGQGANEGGKKMYLK
jgi:hypothetical protein